jgi:hypothetical protein
MTDDPEIPVAVRRAFAAGPGDEPALGLTPDGLLGAGRRALRRRRLAGGGAAALVVAGVLAGAVALVPGGGSGTAAATRPTPTAAATTGPAAGETARLTGALQDAVPLPYGATVYGGITPETLPLHFVPSQGGFKAGATVRDAAGVGDLVVWLDPPGYRRGQQDPCAGRGPGCISYVTADGDRVGTAVRRNGEVVAYEVVVLRPAGGHQVLVSATNSVDRFETAAGRKGPVWTPDEVAHIALTPGLR